MNYIDLTPVVLAIIALIAGVVARKLIPWIDSKISDEQRWALKALVRTLVFAAEQLYGSENGQQKLEYVIQELKDRGYTVDRAEIEAAVWEHLNQSKAIEE